MPRHRFKDSRGRTYEVRSSDADCGTTKLFQVFPEETAGDGPLQKRLCDQPLRAVVVTALLQEILDLSGPDREVTRAHQLRAAKTRLAAQCSLLDELEWFGHKDGTKEFCCLWCDRLQSQGHAKGCRWLAATGREKYPGD